MKQQTTIAMLQKQAVGFKIGGFWVSVTHTHKMDQRDGYVHAVTIADNTGEMKADVNVGKKYKPLQRNNRIWVVVGEIQALGMITKLFVHEWNYESITADDLNKDVDTGNVRSRIKNWQVAALLSNPAMVNPHDGLGRAIALTGSSDMAYLIDEIMKG